MLSHTDLPITIVASRGGLLSLGWTRDGPTITIRIKDGHGHAAHLTLQSDEYHALLFALTAEVAEADEGGR